MSPSFNPHSFSKPEMRMLGGKSSKNFAKLKFSEVRPSTGKCWVFAGTECVDALYVIEKQEKYVLFAKQELIDNFYHYYKPSSKNPKGILGSPRKCFEYIKNYGISRDKDWPYTGIKANLSEPRLKPNAQQAIKIKDFEFVDSKHAHKALEKQPLVGSMWVSKNFKELKKGDKYNGREGEVEDIKHAILVVGYGTDEKTRMKYFKIKNSWGIGWGDDGFATVPRCEIDDICYPIGIDTPYAVE